MFELARRNDPFRDLFSALSRDPFFARPNGLGADDTPLAVDVSESDNEVVVRADLPGFEKNDVQVSLHNGVLTINAEHNEEHETKDEKFHRKERRYGMMSRSIMLPGALAEDHVNAELKDGVLCVRVPHAETAKPRRIAVK